MSRVLVPAVVIPLFFAITGGVTAHASSDVTTVSSTGGLATLTGTAQCGDTTLPGATVHLFSGKSVVASGTADASGLFSLGPAAAGLYTVRIRSGSTICGYQLSLAPPSVTSDTAGGLVTSTTQLTAKIVRQCPLDSRNNHSWTTASLLDALASTPAAATADECLDRQDQSAWFKVPVQPGSQVSVSLTNLPANYDLTLYKDIATAYQSLAADATSLTRLSAEFAPDAGSSEAYAPDAYSPDAYSPDAYSPDAYSPDAYSPDAYSPDAYSPDAYSPDAYSPDAYSPDAYSPDAYSANGYSPATPVQSDATGLGAETIVPSVYAGAQTRSLIGVSAHDGTASEQIVRNSWDNSTNVYIRVRGRNGVFSLAQPFHLAVTVLTTGCGAVRSVAALTAGTTPSLISASAGSFSTIILWDSARATQLENWSADDVSAVASHLAALASQTAGVVVDVSQDDQVKAANLQADANQGCAFAKNLVGLEIKRIIDGYRSLNPLQYIVLVGNDGLIPFFRHPDEAGLANEHNFVPPVLANSESAAVLNLGYFLSQDRYGSSIALSVNDHSLPLPDLAVGRLVERPADIDGMIDAFLKTLPNGITPTTSLATGYDFFADAATAIANQLSAGLNHPTDTLIQSSGPPTVAAGAWTADQLRAKLFGSRHDLIFLGAHFSAFSAEAADLTTRLFASEIASSTLDWSNVIVFSEGCHSGYNTVDHDALPIPVVEPDFGQAFAQKQVTLIGGTGYQYGDTDFIEYGERLYLDFSQQLRMGTGPVSVGQALVAAKKAYLRESPEWRGIHEKTLLEATLYGLPQLLVNMPGSRLTPSVDPSMVSTTTPFPSNPGSLLGLSSADLTVQSSLTPHTVTLNSTVGAAPLTATYLSGSSGQVANPNEPVLPLESRTVTAPNVPAPTLRGVGFRGGTYTDNPTGGPVLPLTDAPATEQRAVHSLFYSSVLYPVVPWQVNYFDALTGGTATRLEVTPAQYQSSAPGSQTGTLRAFSSMNFRLYYSDPSLSTMTFGKTAAYPGNIPALSAAPAISKIAAVPTADGQTLNFRVNVEGDPSAGIQQVWITYTAVTPSCSGGLNPCAGQWQPLDLVQDGSDSTLWTGSLALGGTAAGDVRYLVQAVNGVGVVGTATNMGAYYIPAADSTSAAAPKQPTSVSFSSTPNSGAYRDQASFTAVLTSNGTPVAGRPLVFAFGPQKLKALTDASGSATVTFPLLQTPGQYQVSAAFNEAPDLLASSAEAKFTIGPQNTTLTLSGGSAHYGGSTGVVATLADQSAGPRRLREQTVIFVVSGGQGSSSWVVPVITDELGRAPLGQLALPPGSYSVTAYFNGTIPVPTASGVIPLTLSNDRYTSSSATLNGGLTIVPEPATVSYSGDRIDAVNTPIHVAGTVSQATDDPPGDLTKAQVGFVIKDAGGNVVDQTTASVAADGTTSASLPALPAGLYQVEATVAGGLYSAPTTTSPLVIYDPTLSISGQGTVPSGQAPPNDQESFNLNAAYSAGATTPTGQLTLQTSRSAVTTTSTSTTLSPSPPPTPDPSATLDPTATLTATPTPTPAPTPSPSPSPTDSATTTTQCQGSVDPSGPINFNSTSIDWLVINGTTAQAAGAGTLNGCANYRFRVIVAQGGTGTGTFEIHVWDASHTFDTPLVLVSGTVTSGSITITPGAP